MKIYYYAPFWPNPYGHGGEKRSHQIACLLRDLGIEFEKLDLLPPVVNSSRFVRLWFLLSNLKYLFSLKLNIRSKYHLQIISQNLMLAKSQLPNVEPGSVIIYEHSIMCNWFIPILLAKNGCKIVALPHNLESLVPDQKSGLGAIVSPLGFWEEIASLRVSECVFVISKEEQWLLNLFGLKSVYYPYLPSEEETKLLSKIATQRQNRKRNRNYLIFGSVGNPPTRIGMLELLKFLQKESSPLDRFHIVGFHSESLANEFDFSSKFIFHGSVSVEKLHELFVLVDAAIIHQTPSTGALTKIPELLTCHVKVVCNHFAARNYFNTKGVSVYYSLTDLCNLLSENANFELQCDYVSDGNLKLVKDSLQEIVIRRV